MPLFLSLESLPPPPWYMLRIFQLYLPQQKSALRCTSSCFFTLCVSVASTSLISLHCFAHAHPAMWMAFLALNVPHVISYLSAEKSLVFRSINHHQWWMTKLPSTIPTHGTLIHFLEMLASCLSNSFQTLPPLLRDDLKLLPAASLRETIII